MPASGAAKYTSKIIKAGALLPDTKMLLEYWDLQAGVATNLQLMMRENLFGKASRSRIEDILTIFRQRYLTDSALLSALVTLVKAGWSSSNLDPVLYYLSLRSDALLHGAVTEVLVPMLNRGRQDIRVDDISTWIQEQVTGGRTDETWGDYTVLRAARGVMSTLRDFGILQGKVNKQLSPLYLPVEAFAFVAFLLARDGAAGERLTTSPEWQIFFLPPASIELFFLEAHQERLLEYRSAGRVVRIEFPTPTIEDYAHALAQRTH